MGTIPAIPILYFGFIIDLLFLPFTISRVHLHSYGPLGAILDTCAVESS